MQLILLFICLAFTACRSHKALLAENLMLRHQLIVLQRSVGRPQLRPTDRLLWAAGLRRLPNWRKCLVIVQPETVIRWHRMGFLFLMFDVLTDRFLIPTHRGYKVPSCPKVVANEIAPPIEMDTRYVDCAFPFDVPNDLRNRMLWWNRYEHVGVVRQQMPLLHLTSLLSCQSPQHFPQFPTQSSV